MKCVGVNGACTIFPLLTLNIGIFTVRSLNNFVYLYKVGQMHGKAVKLTGKAESV